MMILKMKQIGLAFGGMDYKDIGFSNIRVPNDDKSYIYKYDARVNLFPEEVFIHEFLHTMERISEEYGLEYPLLHDNEKYGYEVQPKLGLKNWYGDFMKKQIELNGTYIGLNPSIYYLKPVHQNAFEYAMEIDIQNEPDNIIEEIKIIIETIINSTRYIKRSNT